MNFFLAVLDWPKGRNVDFASVCHKDGSRSGMMSSPQRRRSHRTSLCGYAALLILSVLSAILASPIDTALLSHNLTLPSTSSSSSSSTTSLTSTTTTTTISTANTTNNLTTPGHANIHCLPSSLYPSFITPSFSPRDCVHAIRAFNDRTAFPQGSETFEFVAAGTVPHYLEPKQRTPQKWWSGTCVVAVVLLSEFEEAELPGGTWSNRKNDLTDFGTMLGEAMDVDRACLDPRWVLPGGGGATDGVDVARRGKGEPAGGGGVNFVQDVGFAVVGHFQAMGVFLWDTSSFVNTRIRTVEEVAAARAGNATSRPAGADGVLRPGGDVDELPQTT